jgi:geranylgeranyl diphosphate synthase, type I
VSGTTRRFGDFARLRGLVDAHLGDFVAARLSAAADLDRVVLEPLADLLLRDGKRLRPALCVWAWRGAGGAGDGADRAGAEERAVRAATCLELLQGCALIHDDVMDASDLRRGARAVHRELADRHAAAGWRGESGRFGLAAAIVAGDLCLVWADRMLRESGLPDPALRRAAPLFDEMRAQTIRGQYLDLLTQAQGTLQAADALAVAEAKTAASTTAGPLGFGAALAGAGPRLQAAYAGYGVPLGIAFQLRDDLLGTFGDPAHTGKPSSDDLRDGKCTVLLSEARRRAAPAAAREIDALLRLGTEDAVPRLRELVELTGARTHVEKLIADLAAQAMAALDDAPLIDPSVREPLGDLLGLIADPRI